MPWRIEQRRIGRAGGLKERQARQSQWDRTYGEGMWEIGYPINEQFVPQLDALESVYNASYRLHFEQHPEDLEQLVRVAKALRNPHAEATTGVDLQIPAIEQCLRERGLSLRGDEVVDIGSWKGKRSHPISERLSPLQLTCCINPKMTLENFWQTKKCLAVWKDE